MNRKVFFPVLLIFGLLVLDKIVLLPSIQDCCVKKGLRIFFDNLSNDDFVEKEKYQIANRENKKLVINFGSSMSYGYYYSMAKNDSARESGRWNIINLSYPGAGALSYFVRMTQILDRGIRPDLITVELAPGTLNRKTPWYKTEIQEMPVGFVFRNYGNIPLSHLVSFFVSRIFATSRYKIGSTDDRYDRTKLIFQKFLQRYEKEGQVLDPPVGFLFGQEPGSESIVNQFKLEMLRETLRGFVVDEDSKKYIFALIKRAESEKIKVIFWYPKLHPATLAIAEEKGHKEIWDRFIGELKKGGGVYLDMNGKVNCNYFLDPMHMDVRCFPEALTRKLELFTLDR